MADVDQAKAHLSASDVVGRSATDPLQAAVTQFNAADGLLHSPLLAPLDIVPVVGRQLRSVQDLSAASGQVARIGAKAIDQAHSVLESSQTSGGDRVVELRRLARLAADTDTALGRIDTGPADALVSPIASKRDTFVSDLTEVRTRLQHAAGVAGTMAGILQGPQSYLLLMANNAEMRAGTGNFLEVGVLTTQDGHLHLANLNQTVNIPVPAGKVTATGDLEAQRWGWLQPGQDWRNLGYTPQFDVNAPLAAQMWQAETGQHVDGVIAVDLEALHQILEVTGPVTLDDGTSVGADNVIEVLAHDQYEGLGSARPHLTPRQAPGRSGAGGPVGVARPGSAERARERVTRPQVVVECHDLGHRRVATSCMWSDANPRPEADWVQAGVAGQL